MSGEVPGTATRAGRSGWSGWSGWFGWLVAAVAVAPLLRWLVLVHAVPAGQPWRAACPDCGTKFSPGTGLSPLLPAARCGGCRRRIGAAPYALESAALLAAALVMVAGFGRTPAEIATFGLWAAAAVALGVVDYRVHRLPDRLTLPAAAGVLALLGTAAAAGAGGSWVRAALAAGACGAGFALVSLLAGERAFGWGDAKLALSAGALLGWVGWSAVLGGLFVAFVASGVVAAGLLLTRRAGRRDSLPFGPFLATGTLLTLALT